ncbi:MAG: DUF2281 domain-containing protein [Methylovulum sp.]|uniref:DUF2281 domain-containing protein n=1 Tax=Methylovulum sp. TaxID=1916980 RepID=UPI00261D8ACE|nr:DUF2281 domain-containing protein [Methylovulum sp.]MDD2722755.1 DUF2281 domain-containing protein [Methylovulum sp.]MDD5126084.1 DUF2281 domain-containing protein [Methylovulum sp.]
MCLDEIIQQHAKTLSPAQQAEVFDFVLFLEQKQTQHTMINNHQQRKERLKNTLDNAVALDIFTRVDGVAWQNEQRQDRSIEPAQP